jgi:hypothetical protein
MAPTLSGQKAVTTAGTAVQLAADQVINAPLIVKALSTNTGSMYIGNVSGDVDSTTGFELSAGDVLTFIFVGNLNSIWVDSAVNGEKVCWSVLDL